MPLKSGKASVLASCSACILHSSISTHTQQWYSVIYHLQTQQSLKLLCCCAGQFYECLNMASLYKLPCIFVVENNLWAIGMNHPRATSLSGEDDSKPYIYKKGPAFGMPGVLVDGMDVMKVTSLCTLLTVHF